LGRLTVTETGGGRPLQLLVHAARLGLRIKETAVPRVYLDPYRAFGGVLDNAKERLAYYRQIITAAEHDDLGSPTTPTLAVDSATCCGSGLWNKGCSR
jgi:hypothetical protein